MKKLYKNPEINIIKIQTAQMIAESLRIQGDAQGNTMLSRDRNGFFDDEDDDY